MSERPSGPGAVFGRSVALAGDAMLVAAGDPPGMPFAGSVRVFGPGGRAVLEPVPVAMSAGQ